MSINPRLISNNKQQSPLVFGQNGLGADIVSTTTPPFLEVFVLTVDGTSDGGIPLL